MILNAFSRKVALTASMKARGFGVIDDGRYRRGDVPVLSRWSTQGNE
jgi:hypothetical protein